MDGELVAVDQVDLVELLDERVVVDDHPRERQVARGGARGGGDLAAADRSKRRGKTRRCRPSRAPGARGSKASGALKRHQRGAIGVTEATSWRFCWLSIARSQDRPGPRAGRRRELSVSWLVVGGDDGDVELGRGARPPWRSGPAGCPRRRADPGRVEHTLGRRPRSRRRPATTRRSRRSTCRPRRSDRGEPGRAGQRDPRLNLVQGAHLVLRACHVGWLQCTALLGRQVRTTPLDETVIEVVLHEGDAVMPAQIRMRVTVVLDVELAQAADLGSGEPGPTTLGDPSVESQCLITAQSSRRMTSACNAR